MIGPLRVFLGYLFFRYSMAAVHQLAPDLDPKDPQGVTRDRHRLISSQPNPSLAQQLVVGGPKAPLAVS